MHDFKAIIGGEAPEAESIKLAALHAAAIPDAWSMPYFALLLRQPAVVALLMEGVGFILCRAAAGEAEILTFAVVPEHQRQGIGRALLQAALAEAARRGATTMFLEVAADNAAALLLYQKAEFTEVGRRQHYYNNGQDALVLRRSIM